MASFYNPYLAQTAVPLGYSGQQYNTAVPMPQSYAAPQPPMQSNVIGVDGEIGAKAFNIPNGSTGPIALWDTNDNVIYMRTFNAAGMPMPLKRLRYVEEEPVASIPAQSGAAVDTSQFVTKSDLEQLRNEIRQMAAQNHSAKNAVNPNNQGRQG